MFTDFSDFLGRLHPRRTRLEDLFNNTLPQNNLSQSNQSPFLTQRELLGFVFQNFKICRTFLGDFSPQKLPSRRLQGLREQDTRRGRAERGWRKAGLKKPSGSPKANSVIVIVVVVVVVAIVIVIAIVVVLHCYCHCHSPPL